MRRAHILSFAVALAAWPGVSSGMERFPPPDFVESGHELPITATPAPESAAVGYFDALVLAGALAAATYLALARRSRRLIFALTICSLAYFGFWRAGCVCAIGSLQNVTLAAFDASYAAPPVVMAFFFLPLVSTLFFGRTFCAAVCPLGAIQDAVVLRPVRIPAWVEHSLGLVPWVYLAAAVLAAATGSAFLICRYDPFVAFFRASGSLAMLSLGATFLVAGVFVARPYCRFLCPYGALLRVCSSASKWHVRIAPEECIECRLCEDSCPFGAILAPNKEQSAGSRKEGVRRLALLLGVLPALVAAGALVGGPAGAALSRVDAEVRLAERVGQEKAGAVAGTTDASDAFRRTCRAEGDLFASALSMRCRFSAGGRFLGAFVGLVVWLKLVSLSVRRTRTGYEPDRAKCLSCGRCFDRCPQQRALTAKKEGAER